MELMDNYKEFLNDLHKVFKKHGVLNATVDEWNSLMYYIFENYTVRYDEYEPNKFTNVIVEHYDTYNKKVYETNLEKYVIKEDSVSAIEQKNRVNKSIEKQEPTKKTKAKEEAE